MREYWIADPARRAEVYRRRGAVLHLETSVLAGETLTSPLLPGLAPSVARVFRHMDA